MYEANNRLLGLLHTLALDILGFRLDSQVPTQPVLMPHTFLHCLQDTFQRLDDNT